MIFECGDYRTFLKGFLATKIRKNSSYSLRAFSKQIGISPSMLSEVLKGKKKLSVDKAAAMITHMGLTEDEERYFLALVQLDNTDDPKRREKLDQRLKALAPNREIRDIHADHLQTIANWICAAGMALLTGHPDGLTAAQIADRLAVTPYEAAEAMDRWIGVGLMKKTGDRYRPLTPDHLMMKSPAPNGALREFHRSMLEKAIDSLETQTPEEKLVGSETLAIDPRKLKEISDVLEEAAAKIIRIAKQPAGPQKEVYHFGFQFFRITRKA